MPDPAEAQLEPESHDVFAFYDNATALAVGDPHGWPTLDCTCDFRALAPTWEEAGALYDEHVSEVRNA